MHSRDDFDKLLHDIDILSCDIYSSLETILSYRYRLVKMNFDDERIKLDILSKFEDAYHDLFVAYCVCRNFRTLNFGSLADW